MSGDFIDKATFALLAENANGGVCSIAVNNILTDVDKLDHRQPFPAFYLLDTDEYVPNPPGGPQFKALTTKRVFENGTSAKIGFVDHSLGCLVEKDFFVPLIDLHDRRGTQTCSYGIFHTAPGQFDETIVATTEDERRVFIAMRDERGLVVAQDILKAIETLTKDKTKATLTSGLENFTQELEEFLDLETVAATALGIDQYADYSTEKRLRRSVARIIKGMGGIGLYNEIVVANEFQEGDGGTATDRLVTTILRENAPSNTLELVQTCEFPHTRNTIPEKIVQIDAGKRLGSLTLNYCVDPDKSLPEAVSYIEDIFLDASRSNYPSVRCRIDTLPAPAQVWTHETYKAMTEHFKAAFPHTEFIFAPLIIKSKGRSYLAMCDIADSGIDLGDKSVLCDASRKWSKTKHDPRLTVVTSKGEKIDTRHGANPAVIEALVKINPRISETIWMTGKDVRQPLRIKRLMARASRSSVQVFASKRQSSGYDIRFRPVAICPFEI